ncbi:pip, partial [Symbiodinium pilosum]
MAHGGPAFSHSYMLPLKQQACRGREVVFYDQVGAGASSQPPLRSAPWLLTVDYYVEVFRVEGLGSRKFHLLGSSWGTILSQAYAFTKDPRLRAIVLSGPLSDGDLYWQSQWDEKVGNLGSLPFFVQ